MAEIHSIEPALADIRSAFSAADAHAKLGIFRRAIALCVASMPTASDQVVNLFDIVIAQLSQFMDFDALLELSEALSTLERAPRGMLHTLAEGRYSIAKPIIEKSPAIDESVLIRIANRGDEDFLFSIARRPTISIRLSDILITKGGRATILTLAKNAGAQFSDYGIELLVTNAGTDPTLQMILTRRTDLPPAATSRLAVLMEIRMASALERAGQAPEIPEHRLIVRTPRSSSALDELRTIRARAMLKRPTH